MIRILFNSTLKHLSYNEENLKDLPLVDDKF